MTGQRQALKHSKRVLAGSWFGFPAFIASVALLLVLPVKAQAGSSSQTLIYDVYASGFHAVQATLEMDLSDKDRYDLVVNAHTRGFLKTVAPWEGTFETHGWVLKDQTLQPELHKSTAIWRDEADVKEYFYAKDGSFKGFRVTDADKPAQDRDIDDELTQNTIDVLTATLAMLQNVAKGEECTSSAEVFDGKRRYEMIFNHEDDVELQSSRYNIYEGPATKCTIEVKPIAGAWHKKPRGWFSIQEQGRERGSMPTVWMGTIDENGPAIPIKILVKTKYGALFMHLVEYQNGTEVLVADKRAD